MNTDQKYDAPASGATASQPIEPAATTPGQTPSTAEDQPTVETVPFEPAFVNLPVYLAIHGRDDNNYGASQVWVLMDALSVYHEHVSNRPKCDDNETTVLEIDELKENLLGIMYTRLSESSEILHKIKYNQ